MTYCIAIKLNAGLVFLSDSRTNAGLDQINTFRKMMIYEKTHERFMVLMSAGNLSISQSIRELLQSMHIRDDVTGEALTIWNAQTMFDATRVLGAAVREVYERDGMALKRVGVDFNVSMLFGGQIKGEGTRLFQVYSAGNFIEATPETSYFQIGEAKYGKPVLDRVLTEDLPLDAAAKCALVSMDSTLKSNLTVGLPLDLVLYDVDSLSCNKLACIDEKNPYFTMVRSDWGTRLRAVFDSIEDPQWFGGNSTVPLVMDKPLAIEKITSPGQKMV